MPKIPIISKNASNESSIYSPPLPPQRQKGEKMQEKKLLLKSQIIS